MGVGMYECDLSGRGRDTAPRGHTSLSTAEQRGGTTSMGLHHSGVQGLGHLAAKLNNRGQQAAGKQFRDLEIDVTHPGMNKLDR